ncbi:TraR/DksA family transcriptional regulator [Streptomyces fuscigenes]|uniref:TraR/DksA family transcriptional regulator n=1 Tax=Streptomyces fuscigenes TaxID=1528880 RepID=UPI001F266F65|nr:TraR/DksA C4-type zinc finger protein [Streptomyces fuscigenes]MCF3963335.1 TraR/DksA C4-type zinc finger protein [Streptomyces fuscigenes]
MRREAERLRARIDGAGAEEERIRADCVLDAADAGSVDEAVRALRAETRAAKEQREQVLATLSRLEEGTFGVCARCGAPIGEERMAALPHTRLCIACRRAEESAG